METPKVTFTNIKDFNFSNKIEEVKTDNKNNLVAVDKDTGNVTVYSFDQNIPPDFKKGIAMNNIVFEDDGKDDGLANKEEINKFMSEVIKAGTKYDPSQHLNMLNKKIHDFKNNMDDRVGLQNLTYYVNENIDKLFNSLERRDTEQIEKSSRLLTNVAKQFVLNRFYLPDIGMTELPRPEYKLGQDLREITYIADFISERLKENEIKNGIN